MTGSGMPMRFAPRPAAFDRRLPGRDPDDGRVATQSYPFTPNTLLDNALGPHGYYGAFTANMHTDNATSSRTTSCSPRRIARGVPMISARQMLTWLDGRNASSFSGIGWSGNQLSFTVTVGTGANGLTGMVPTVSNGGQTLTA